jgi:hypothetical protein
MYSRRDCYITHTRLVEILIVEILIRSVWVSQYFAAAVLDKLRVLWYAR